MRARHWYCFETLRGTEGQATIKNEPICPEESIFLIESFPQGFVPSQYFSPVVSDENWTYPIYFFPLKGCIFLHSRGLYHTDVTALLSGTMPGSRGTATSREDLKNCFQIPNSTRISLFLSICSAPAFQADSS